MKINYKFYLYTNLNKHNFITNKHELITNPLKKLKLEKKLIKNNKKKLFIIFENKKETPLTKKISSISSMLENFRILNIKKKTVFILFYRSKNNMRKLEKKIFLEMINAYNNMFSLNIFFYEKAYLKSKIDLTKLVKKYKL